MTDTALATTVDVPRVILVGVDYTPASLGAAKFALMFARAFGARAHFLHAWAAPYAQPDTELAEGGQAGPGNLLALVRRSAEDTMAQFVASLEPGATTVTTSIESGDPQTVLIQYAHSHGCDWVVLGKPTHSPVAEWFLGNVAAYVVRHCQVPVLVVPSDEVP